MKLKDQIIKHLWVATESCSGEIGNMILKDHSDNRMGNGLELGQD